MRVLITGATGLIGTQLCSYLLSKGHSLNILTTRTPWQTDRPQTRVFQWSPQKMQIDHRSLEGVDAIINLAGSKINQRWTTKNKRTILNSRIQSTGLLFDAVKQSKQKPHLINASAIGIYPSDFHDNIPSQMLFFQTILMVRLFVNGKGSKQFEKLSCKTTILRIGLVLSNKGGAFVPLSQPTRWGLGAWFGNGQQWQSWIHIDDLIGLIDFCLQNQLEGCINATAPNPVRQRI